MGRPFRNKLAADHPAVLKLKADLLHLLCDGALSEQDFAVLVNCSCSISKKTIERDVRLKDLRVGGSAPIDRDRFPVYRRIVNLLAHATWPLQELSESFDPARNEKSIRQKLVRLPSASAPPRLFTVMDLAEFYAVNSIHDEIPAKRERYKAAEQRRWLSNFLRKKRSILIRFGRRLLQSGPRDPVVQGPSLRGAQARLRSAVKRYRLVWHSMARLMTRGNLRARHYGRALSDGESELFLSALSSWSKYRPRT